MIFVTVGSMFPFDRLIRAMDGWAARNAQEHIFAQIGDGSYLPQNMPYARMVPPSRFHEICHETDLIVAHAGMGSVISAAEIGKPIILFPRHAAWKEHTTDHQLHTAGWLRDRPGVFIADDDEDLDLQIENAKSSVNDHQRLSPTAPAEFVTRIRHALAN